MSKQTDLARFNMVEQQVRPWAVLDTRVLNTLMHVKREQFVPSAYAGAAFADVEIPLDAGQHMLKPVVEGRLLQALQIQEGEEVLQVGTGSGFLTVCMAHLGGMVTSIDIEKSLADAARARIAGLNVFNTNIQTADVFAFEPKFKFAAIAVCGAVNHMPDKWKSWLKVGGRLFVIQGKAPAMQAVLLTKIAESQFQQEILFETATDYLQGAQPVKQFHFAA
jgi:protein-L-isoaspartate(D-aspartate) O-methyltransferase